MDTAAIASTQEQLVARQTRQVAASSATVVSFAQFMINVHNAAEAHEPEEARQVDPAERQRRDEPLDDAGEAERDERPEADRSRDGADSDQLRQGQEPVAAEPLGGAGPQLTEGDGETAGAGTATTQTDAPTAVDGAETATTEPSHESDAKGHGPSDNAAAQAAAATAADPAAGPVPAPLVALMASANGQEHAAASQSPHPLTEALAVAATPNGTATALPGLASATPAASRQRGGNAGVELPGQATQALAGAGQSAAAKASVAANAIAGDGTPAVVEKTAAPPTVDVELPNAEALVAAKDAGEPGRTRATLLSEQELGGQTRHNPPPSGVQAGPATAKAALPAQPEAAEPQPGNGQTPAVAAAVPQVQLQAVARSGGEPVAMTADGVKAAGDPLAHTLGSGVGNGANSADPGSATAAARASRAPVPTHPAAEQVAVRVHKAIADGTDKIEIQLRPAALGRVKVALEVTHDGRVMAVVTASNPDTLDMLRHNAHALERALQNAGLSADSNSLSFTLGGGEDRAAAFDAPGGEAGEPDADAGDPADEAGLVAARPLYGGTGSGLLDIHV